MSNLKKVINCLSLIFHVYVSDSPVDSSLLNITGIKWILSEVADPLKRDGGVGLLYYVMMRGNSKSFHSKARRVLRFLLKDSTLSFCDNSPQGKFPF